MSIEHNYPFDPANGMTCEELLTICPPAEPEGFRDFWADNYRLVMEAPLKYALESEIWSPDPTEKIYRLRVTNYDGVEFVMWINRPEHSAGGVVVGQGYGNPATPPAATGGFTICFAAVRGLGPSQCKEIPWQPHRHVLHGIDSKENYILRGVISDQWMAARVMLDMFPDCAGNLNYMGGSMGGGMGALLLPWDKRFRSAVLHVPTFGCVARYDYQTNGTGEHCRQYLEAHPEAMEVLKYFDGSISAKYITIPVCCTPALFDPCVAPVGQFSIVNAIAEEYKTLLVRDTGHFAMTEKDKKVEEQLKVWCKENFLL